jgi:hypothetical protein
MLKAKPDAVANQRQGKEPSARMRKSSRGPIEFTTLDELQRRGAWLTPPCDLVLERFSISFPDEDITTLAYQRELG